MYITELSLRNGIGDGNVAVDRKTTRTSKLSTSSTNEMTKWQSTGDDFRIEDVGLGCNGKWSTSLKSTDYIATDVTVHTTLG